MHAFKVICLGVVTSFFFSINAFSQGYSIDEGRRQAERYNWKIHLTPKQKCQQKVELDPNFEKKSDREKELEIISHCGPVFPDITRKPRTVQIKGTPIVVDDGVVTSPKLSVCRLLAVRGTRLKSLPLNTVPPGTVLASSKKEENLLYYEKGNVTCEVWAKDVATAIIADLKNVTNIENGDSYQASSVELPVCRLLAGDEARLIDAPTIILKKGTVIASSHEESKEGKFFDREGKTCTDWRAEVAEKLIVKPKLEE